MAEVNQSPQANKGTGSRQHRKSTRIDMTAMVDVAFLLLTFFILTTTLATPKAMKMVLPTGSEGNPMKCSKILELFPGDDHKVHWYAGCSRDGLTTTDLNDTGLRNVILSKLAANKELVITIKPTAKTDFSTVVDVLDEMLITGAPRYALAPLAPEDIEMLDSKNLK